MIKLLQGDCMELMNNIPNESIDLVLTDIPYNVVNREDNGLRKLDKENADVLTSFFVEKNKYLLYIHILMINRKKVKVLLDNLYGKNQIHRL